ncbi:MAG: Flp pilus assembly complex ATPase component TadA [Candidatus Pacebacteria bacterium]|nr:Flp pilus assembly complex ATPase component TadA [Candidatus Paceibacterota bacterium]
MFETKLKITDPTNDVTTELVPDGQTSFSVGRGAQCEVRLKEPTVSQMHATLIWENGHWWVTDATSTAGTFVNGRRIMRELLLDGTTVFFGKAECRINIDNKADSHDSASSQSSYDKIKEFFYEELVRRLDLRKLQEETLSDEELEQRVRALLQRIEGKHEDLLDQVEGQEDELEDEIVQNLLGLGPLEPLLEDDDITEIMAVGFDRIYLEKEGKLQLSDRRFRDGRHLLTVIERIVAPLGRRIDESSPLVDARLPDGSRVNAVISPIAPDGSCLTIRKFGKTVFDTDKLVSFGSLTPEMAKFLDLCVKARKNIIVSGGTGSGKTSLLNALSLFIGHDERIVTIEDSLELKLQQDHVVRMEARPPNAEGKGEITIRRLVINSLRMRPDRIVVGECRGGEALDMLQAMNTGHDGSLTTVHANSPRDAVSRLETLVLMAGMDLPLSAIRNQIVSAVDIIVQTGRLADGSRKVISITEMTGLESDKPLMQELFTFRQTGIDHAKGNRVLGCHIPTGVPSFVEELKARGLPLDMSWFQDGELEHAY